MTAYQLVSAVVPRSVKRRLRGHGTHRAPGLPLLINGRLTAGRHKDTGGWGDVDPWLLYELERKDYS